MSGSMQKRGRVSVHDDARQLHTAPSAFRHASLKMRLNAWLFMSLSLLDKKSRETVTSFTLVELRMVNFIFAWSSPV